MAKSTKLGFSSLFLLLSTLLALLHASAAASSPPQQQHGISAIFAFGDSTLDAGNNNALKTLVRSDHAPYGIDFPGHTATGRFTNGKIITDFLAASLHLKDRIPPFSMARNLTSSDLATGVSFASAGSGLDDLTAAMANVTTIAKQLADFNVYIQRLKAAVGEEEATKILNSALFVIGVGSNDMMMNYYLVPVRKLTYLVAGYHQFLLNKLQSLVQQLFQMGARKFAISGFPPLGCLPLQITLNAITSSTHSLQRTCVTQQNSDSTGYNSMLQYLMQRMKATYSGSKFAYVDIYNPLMDMVTNPQKYGFINTNLGCCGTGLLEMGPLCNANLPTCPFRSRFMFWDSVHPSQATYQALANEFLQTLPQFGN